MSTTRTISDTSQLRSASRVPYTVVGGARWDRIRKYPFDLTILVLSRGDRLFRAELLRELDSRDSGEVVWVEGPVLSSDVEALSREFPRVRFLRVNGPCTDGERIDIGIAEARSPLVFCIWSDARPSRFPRDLPAYVEKLAAVCVLPVIHGPRREPIPTWQSPGGRQRRLAPKFRPPREDGEKCLFPFDYCGVYSRDRFSKMGGFDPSIANPYWQKLDFGLRCWLWGERIVGSTRLSVVYTAPPPADDTTPDESYKAFYLKNLAVRIRNQVGILPWLRLPEYMLRSDKGPLYAVKEFAAARAWVRFHRFRFRREPRELLERWETG